MKDGITRISPILPCVLFPYISGFIASAFIRFVRFAHGANLRTLALSLRSNAVYATSFAPNSRKQRLIALFSAVWSEIDGITHIVFLSCSFAIRNIFFFAHYGFLQVRQVCARRKLAHPRIVASLQCRVRHVFRSKRQKTARNCAVFCLLERKTGFEPATTGLGSRDSTVELLSPSL